MSLIDWFHGQIGLRIILGALFILIVGRWYFKRTSGGGVILFSGISASLAAVFMLFPSLQLASWIGIPVIWFLERKNSEKKAPYSTPIASVEGGGIKRGLTPAEASILLGSSFAKTVLMVVFGLLQKDVLRIISISPLIVEINQNYKTKGRSLDGEERRRIRKAAANEENIVLHAYEELMLEILEGSPALPIDEIDFSILFMPLVELTVERLAGWELEASRDYYQKLVERSPIEMRMEGILISEQEKILERNLLWIMLHTDFKTIFDNEERNNTPKWFTPKKSEGTSFGEWVSGVLNLMERKHSTVGKNVKAYRDLDEMTAKLADDISRATFYS